MKNLKQELKVIIDDKNIVELRKKTQYYFPIDFANALSDFNEWDIVKCMRWMKNDFAADVFTHFSPEIQKFIIVKFTDPELSKLLEEFFVDEIVDLTEELPSNMVKKILRLTNPKARTFVNKILQYKEDSSGSIMSVNFMKFRDNITVEQALLKIKNNLEFLDETEHFFIVSNTNILLGTVSLKTLVFNKPEKLLSEILDSRVISVSTNEDQKIAANRLQEYDLDVIPVVNFQNRLVGIIDANEVLDIFEEEATKDIQQLAGIEHIEKTYFETSVFRMVRSRSLWLLFLMISATASQLVIQLFLNIYGVTSEGSNSTDEITIIVTTLLIPVLPLVSGTSGNAGSQSSTMIVRALSLGNVKTKDLWAVLWKEFRVALLAGLILTVINFCRMVIIYFAEGDHHISYNEWLSIIVLSISLYLTVIIAKLVGSMLPILAKAIKLDPAVMAAPLLTTLVDALSTAIFFSIGAIFFLT